MYGRLFSTIQVVRNTEKKCQAEFQEGFSGDPLKFGDLATAGCGEVTFKKWPNCPPAITKTMIRFYFHQKY